MGSTVAFIACAIRDDAGPDRKRFVREMAVESHACGKSAAVGKTRGASFGKLARVKSSTRRRTDSTRSSQAAPDLGALREVPYMGVIFVVAEAMKLGFVNGHADWCNLGQGQPEVGPMRGAPKRVDSPKMEMTTE